MARTVEGAAGSLPGAMEHVRWERRPDLRRPVLVAAFEGWQDAAAAASTAVEHLGRAFKARPFASIDPEDFYDFTVIRPKVRLGDDMTRYIEWPAPRFSAAPAAGGDGRDLVLLEAIEPGLRWRTFCGEIVDVAQAIGAELVVTLGAMLADVPHTRPVRVIGVTTDPDLVQQLGFIRSRYEGSTGILGVLTDASTRVGLRCASLWASTPSYLRDIPSASPTAALALISRLDALLGIATPVTDLEITAAAYERQVNDLVASDDDMAAWVTRLEVEADRRRRDAGDEDDGFGPPAFEIPHRDALAAEVERFLRDHRDGHEGGAQAAQDDS